MQKFPYGNDVRFTIIPKLGDTVLTKADMLGLNVKVVNKKMGVSFIPDWNWTSSGIEVEVQREDIPIAASYNVNMDFHFLDSSFSDGKKDILHYCTVITFADDCEVQGEERITAQIGSRYAVINVVEELPDLGTPGEFYATLVENVGG